MVAIGLATAFICAAMGLAWSDEKSQPWYTWAGMNCGEPGAYLRCPQPDVANDASCKDSCERCTHCVATVVSYAAPGQPKCLFRGCDTKCAYYDRDVGGGMVEPLPDAFPSQHLTLHSRVLTPHFCRQFAYDHHGVAGSVTTHKPYLTWTGMDCNEANAQTLQCAEPAEATPERCQIACDDCSYCVAVVMVQSVGGKAKCEFRGCDTSCGCYSTGSGQCAQDLPPTDALASEGHVLFSKMLDPHFCRDFAFTHGGVAGHVVSKAIPKTSFWAVEFQGPSEHSLLKRSQHVRWSTAVLACMAVAAISTMASVLFWARAAHRQSAVHRNLIATDAVEAQEAATGTDGRSAI